jgi:hypothetical protein
MPQETAARHQQQVAEWFFGELFEPSNVCYRHEA